MSRAVIVAGYLVLGTALLLMQRAAVRGERQHRSPRLTTFGELLDVFLRRGPLRWLVLTGWLWLGWHVFARVEWR